MGLFSRLGQWLQETLPEKFQLPPTPKASTPALPTRGSPVGLLQGNQVAAFSPKVEFPYRQGVHFLQKGQVSLGPSRRLAAEVISSPAFASRDIKAVVPIGHNAIGV